MWVPNSERTGQVSGQPALPEASYAKLDGLAARLPWRGCAHASNAYRQTIKDLGVGSRDTPALTIHAACGKQVGWVSYNGRVWAGDADSWRAQLEAELVYCPTRDGSHAVS